MNSIFISYRRDDGIDTAQLLQISLQKIFGEEAVFLDTNTMKPGDEFPAYLQSAMGNAKVVIVMIGKNWKGSNPQQNRLANEDDWVRKELEMALQKTDARKKIFPVLVKGATITDSFKDLPPSLQKLSEYNCATLREKEFSQDLLPLIPLIEAYIDVGNPLEDLPLDDESYKYPIGSPFKGLAYFTEKDAKLFFGRGQEIRQLYNIICERNIVFFYGQSGVGKSSLLFAGLKPRMNFKGWNIVYFRRETGVNLANKLHEYTSNLKSTDKQLVILDQVEEMYTNPSAEFSSQEESAQLFKEVKLGAETNINMILSFRKEYLAEFKNLFVNLEVEDFYLKPLQANGVLDAIRGVTQEQKARDIYQLQFGDKTVPATIAQAILSDEQSQVAPLLQILLRKMWDKVSDKKPRIFTKDLFNEVKSSSLLTLINDQIVAVGVKFPEEVASGLVLDILYFFTTPRGTSASHTEEEVFQRYESNLTSGLVTELKNKYLLTEPKEENDSVARLAHDSLAPIIREMFSNSTLPGQRASILLDSKKYEIENLPDKVEFSKADLSIIDAGKAGMRKCTNSESREIEESRQRIKIDEQQREETKIKQLKRTRIFSVAISILALIAAIIAIIAFRQNELADSNRLLSEARLALENNDASLALRLAEASIKMYSDSVNVAFATSTYINNSFYSTEFKGHSDWINSVAFSPDGKHILTGSADSTAQLWDLKGNMIQGFKGHSGEVYSVAFSPDGQWILTGSEDSTARLWNLKGTMIREFKGHSGEVYSVAFSPDGKMVLTGSEDNTARLWNLNGTVAQEFKGHSGEVTSVAYSPDSVHILTGSSDSTARLWDLKGTMIREFKGHAGKISCVTFSPDGKQILTGSYDSTARLWNLKGTMIQEFRGHSGEIYSVAFSSDGKNILTGSYDHTARVWNLGGFTIQVFKDHSQVVMSVAFSPDSVHILTASGDGTAHLWNLKKMIREFKGQVGLVYSVVFSPDSIHILSRSDNGTIRLWDLKGTMICEFKSERGWVNSMAFSPDGKQILTGAFDSTARLWDLKGTLIQEFKGHNGWVNSVAFSPDGKEVLTGSSDSTARLWNLKGIMIQKFRDHSEEIYSVAFSSDGKNVLTGSSDNIARLWDLNGTIIHEFKGHSGRVTSVTFSPDSKCLLTGSYDGTARLWNLKGKMIREFTGGSGNVFSVAFSPDGKYILTSCSDRTARLWNLQGTLIQTFQGFSNLVSSVAFSPNGKYVLTGSFDQSVRLWAIVPYDEYLKSDKIASLTPEQKKQYGIGKSLFGWK
jgi:WD40 repeat protein